MQLDVTITRVLLCAARYVASLLSFQSVLENYISVSHMGPLAMKIGVQVLALKLSMKY